MNTGLKLYDSVLVVPTFYGFYTAFGLINSTIYLDQLGDYQAWVLMLVIAGIGALIYGVRMLSSPKPEHTSSGRQLSTLDNVYDDDEEDSHELEQRSKVDNGTGKFSRQSAVSFKNKSSKRQSRLDLGQDEENDGPFMYGSQRGVLELDDTAIAIPSAGTRTIGESTARTRGMSFTSKSSFQADPFRSPEDNSSISDGFETVAGDRSLLTREHDETPTHVLVDTTDDLHDSEDEWHGYGRDVREQERRRQSILQPSHKTLTMGEKSTHATRFDHPQPRTQQQRPRIDTTVDKRRRESAGFPSSPGMMSPSQFKAHLIETSQQANQQHNHDENDDNDGLGTIPRRPTFNNSPSASPTVQTQRGHSVRWSTGSSKIEQDFEDLNPFKVVKSNHDSIGNNTATGVIRSSSPISSSLPSSPRPPSTENSRPNHARQESFSGLPSEWVVPGRKKRHSMRFSESGRFNTTPEGLVSTDSAEEPVGTITVATIETVGSSPPSTPIETHSRDVNHTFPMPSSPGEKMVSQAGVSSAEVEITPSPRTSRIMSSPEIALGPILALAAAAKELDEQRAK